MRHSLVNHIWTEYINTNYDYVLETYWGGYGRNINYNAKQIIKAEKPNYFNQHEIEHNMQLIRQLGFKNEAPKQYVNTTGLVRSKDKSKRIGICSGGFKGVWQKKKWPYYKQLISKLLDQDFHIFNFGTKDDSIKIKHDNYFDYAGALSLQETVNYMKSLDFFISNDTGLMHVADALEIPLITFFGPTLITKNRPVSKMSHILVSDYSCVPCQYKPEFNSCQNPICLSSITSDYVLKYIEKIWQKNI